MKSRRLAARKVNKGMDTSKAIWVRHTNWMELKRLAARNEKGSWVAKRKAVIIAYRLPSLYFVDLEMGICGTPLPAKDHDRGEVGGGKAD